LLLNGYAAWIEDNSDTANIGFGITLLQVDLPRVEHYRVAGVPVRFFPATIISGHEHIGGVTIYELNASFQFGQSRMTERQ